LRSTTTWIQTRFQNSSPMQLGHLSS